MEGPAAVGRRAEQRRFCRAWRMDLITLCSPFRLRRILWGYALCRRPFSGHCVCQKLSFGRPGASIFGTLGEHFGTLGAPWATMGKAGRTHRCWNQIPSDFANVLGPDGLNALLLFVRACFQSCFCEDVWVEIRIPGLLKHGFRNEGVANSNIMENHGKSWP